MKNLKKLPSINLCLMLFAIFFASSSCSKEDSNEINPEQSINKSQVESLLASESNLLKSVVHSYLDNEKVVAVLDLSNSTNLLKQIEKIKQIEIPELLKQGFDLDQEYDFAPVIYDEDIQNKARNSSDRYRRCIANKRRVCKKYGRRSRQCRQIICVQRP